MPAWGLDDTYILEYNLTQVNTKRENNLKGRAEDDL